MRRVLILATVLALLAPASAAGGGERTVAPATHTLSGARDDCVAEVTTLPTGDVITKDSCGGGDGSAVDEVKPAAQGKRICSYNGTEIDCSHGRHGTWDGSCYVTRSEPQPPKDDATWEGHDDGVIVDCLPYPCVQQGGQANIPENECLVIQKWLSSLPGSVDPALLAQEAIDKMQLRPIEIGVAPFDTPDAVGLVGLPAWFWVEDPADNTYGPISASANAGGTGVTATAQVDHIEWKLGDEVTITCDGPGTPYEERFGEADSPDCGHRFETQGTKTITATSFWIVDWTGGDQEGTIPIQHTAETEITIGELQVLRQ